MKPELVKFELPTTDQFSVAVDNLYASSLAGHLTVFDAAQPRGPQVGEADRL
jgi:hypothetical protein